MNNIEILENKIQCFRHLQNTLDDHEKELFEEGIQQKEVEAIENLIEENKELKETYQGLLDLYNKEKEKNKALKEGLKYRINYCKLLEKELYDNGINYKFEKNRN